jgi:hypothetical protein
MCLASVGYLFRFSADGLLEMESRGTWAENEDTITFHATQQPVRFFEGLRVWWLHSAR